MKIRNFLGCVAMLLFVTASLTLNHATNICASDAGDAVKVTKVTGLDDDFAMGVDISSIISLEKAGVTYYDENGKKTDLFKLMSDSGVNYIRIRIWNNPYNSSGKGYGGGNNDLATAIKIAKRAKKYNMKVLVDLHYSDFWADPAYQYLPKAWSSYSTTEVADAISSYTTKVLKKFDAAGIDVGMIQIGNEINYRFCNQAAFTSGTSYYTYLKAGLDAVDSYNKTYGTSTLKVLHYTNPQSAFNSIASMLAKYNVNYDVFAASYYPEYHGTISNLKSQLKNIKATYNKQVMVAETNYPYTSKSGDVYSYGVSVQAQATFLRDVIDAVNSIGGIGVFYWEPAWPNTATTAWNKYGTGWASDYATSYRSSAYASQSATAEISLFNSCANYQCQALESLKTFKYVKTGKKKIGTVKNVTVSKSSSNVVLKWNKVSNAKYYYIYRATKSNGVYKRIGVTTKKTYTDKTITGGKTYFYRVRAVGKNKITNGDMSSTLTVMIPSQVKKLKCSKANGKTTLKWSKLKTATGYQLYRSTKKNGTYKKVATLKGSSKNKYTFTTGSKKYYYKVRAYYQPYGSSKKIYGKFSSLLRTK